MGKGTTDTLVTPWGLVPGREGMEGGMMGRALGEGEELKGVPGPLPSTYRPRVSHPPSPSGPPNIPRVLSHTASSSPQLALEPLTQHIEICGGGYLGHSVAGSALPAPVGLLRQWSQDEAPVAVHLGLALQPPAHLQNHWSALRTHAATPHQGRHSSLWAAPVSSPPCLTAPSFP